MLPALAYTADQDSTLSVSDEGCGRQKSNQSHCSFRCTVARDLVTPLRPADIETRMEIINMGVEK